MNKLMTIYYTGMDLPGFLFACKGQTGLFKSLHRLLIDWEVLE